MYMRRLLAVLCALCCILSSPFSAAFAVEAPNLDDLGIDPWGDLGIIQDTPEPALDLSQDEVIQDPDQADLAGEGGPAFFSLIPDDRSYLTSFTSPYLTVFSTTTYLTFSSSSYTFPSQIGSGDENMFGSTNLGNGKNSSSGSSAIVSYKIADLTLTCDLPIEATAESMSLSGSLSFYHLFKTNTSSPVTIADIPSTLYYQTCTLQILGSTYQGVLDSSGKSFSFDIQDLDVSSVDSDSLPVKITFSGAKIVDVNFGFGDTTRKYIGVRMMFIDGLQASYKMPENPGGFDEESKGLLRTIVDGVKSIITAIIELPGKIVSGILDGLKALFVPSEEDLQGLKDKYQDLLSERLGFIWQAGEWITSFGSELLAAVTGGAEAEFVFPGVGFDMNGEHYQLIEEQVIDFDSNGIVTVIRPFAGTIVAFVVVIACVNLFHGMVAALISGKSYFDFLKGGGDE